INYLTRDMFYARSPEKRFLMAAVWPDRIKSDGVNAFNQWHFINIPYDRDGKKAKAINPYNVAWAIKQDMNVESSPKANRFEKSEFLAFLEHFVGDTHQPLHCVVMYSNNFPKGDMGGNLFKIN